MAVDALVRAILPVVACPVTARMVDDTNAVDCARTAEHALEGAKVHPSHSHSSLLSYKKRGKRKNNRRKDRQGSVVKR